LLPYGRHHRNYGVTPEMLDVMSLSFVVAIQPTLEEKSRYNEKFSFQKAALDKPLFLFFTSMNLLS